MHIGIDPDLSGALAVLDTVGALVALCDTPVLHLSMARGRGRHEYYVLSLVALLAPYAGPQIHVLLEETHRPCPAKAYRRPFHPARTVFGREEFRREPSAGNKQIQNRRSGSAPQREGLSLSLNSP
jgi:hypothetical protein